MKSKEQFQSLVAGVEASSGYVRPLAYAVGIAHISKKANMLDVYYPHVNYQDNYGTAALLYSMYGKEGRMPGNCQVAAGDLGEINRHLEPFLEDGSSHPNLEVFRSVSMLHVTRSDMQVIACFIYEGEPEVTSLPDAYLRLHLLSHRRVRPHGIGRLKDDLFRVLPNVAWTSDGPMAIEELPARRMLAIHDRKPLTVHSVDKIPRMVDYHVPSGVRIADSARVRLGAYIGEGSTFMHEGFCNFNAGCAGPNMIEGRISAGVFVGKGTDLGGSASTMGTLSGGGKEIITIGENCLIGANGGTGISLGDNCKIEAGFYLTAGMKVTILGNDDQKVVYARELSGKPNLVYRRHSVTGRVEAVPNMEGGASLNDVLHSNQ